MKLGINGWRVHGRRTGVGRYIVNIVKHWANGSVGGRFEEINFYTPAPVDQLDVPLRQHVRQRVLPSNSRMLVWENVHLGPTSDDDVLFCPSHTRPVIARGKIVVTTHDAMQKLFPHLFPMSARLFYTPFYGWSARHATLVITDSEAGRQDIARCWGVPPSKIRVVYLAPAEVFRPLPGDPRVATAQAQYLGSSGPFFLFVGKLSGRRNIPRLLEAFSAFKKQTGLPHKLLMVGLNTHNLNLLSLINKLGLSEDPRY